MNVKTSSVLPYVYNTYKHTLEEEENLKFDQRVSVSAIQLKHIRLMLKVKSTNNM